MTVDDDKASGGNNASPDQNAPPPPVGKDSYGYDLYPERRGGTAKRSWVKTFLMMEGRESMQKVRCEKNIYDVIRSSHLVKLMMAALKSSGCEVDIRRHICCEICDTSVNGGFDPESNQIIVCQNNVSSKSVIQGILSHEMVHMFDYCRNNLDFKNLDHLACTEIRAANLTHCSFLSSCMQGDSSFTNIKKTHEDCVKAKAYMSIVNVRNVTNLEAVQAVERVFPKCYNDMEPIGRRLRPKTDDIYKAYRDGPFYGYDI